MENNVLKNRMKCRHSVLLKNLFSPAPHQFLTMLYLKIPAKGTKLVYLKE